MARIDENRRFIAVNIAVLTVSDTRTAADDTSGDALAARIAEADITSPRARSSATRRLRSSACCAAGSRMRRSTW